MHNGSLILCDLTLADAPAVAAIWIETWLDSYRGILPDSTLDKLSLAQRTQRFEQLLADSKNICFHGVFLGGELLGFASAGRPREQWGYDSELWAISIPKRWQKQGVGRSLLKSCVKYCLEQGSKNLYLYCFEENYNALEFYQHLGARLTDRIKLREGAIERALVWDDLEELNCRLD
ncbi:MAG: GNAT family N-acetyltransferase [Proteobacteria bacterium]|nr:GNAT family N-acetyltransferase [Pseudomonadota bacterium]